MKGNYMALDLAKNNLSVAADIGFEFEVRLPSSSEPTGAFITVRGEESKTVKAFGRNKFKEFQQKQAQAKRRGKDVEDMTLEDAEELSVETAVVRVMGWRGITDNGEEVKFSPEAAAKIFKEHSWIREQVMEESSQILNFRPTGN
jgi:hypothetical protein